MVSPLDALLGENPILEQIVIWSAVGQLIAPFIAPFAREVENESNREFQRVPLTPDALARVVLRGYGSIDDVIDEAKSNGISPHDFGLLVKTAGNAPAPEALAEALRRGYIPDDDSNPDVPSFRGGIRQGDLQNKWADVIKRLATSIPTPEAILQALVEGQIDLDSARDEYTKVGGAPEYFDLLYHTRGESPTPLQAADMAHRGAIPWDGTGPDVVSYEQGFKEGRWRNKWQEPFRKISEYLPPPRTVTAMVREGALTDAQATDLFKQSGLSVDMAASYLAAAKSGRTQAHKELTLGLIGTLYEDEAISSGEATDLIKKLGYDDAETKLIISVHDLKRQVASINRAISTIHTAYIGRKISREEATGYLDETGIQAKQRDTLLGTWDTERKARVTWLTPTQICQAANAGFITVDDARQRLEDHGYSSADATIFMKLKGVTGA